MISKCEICEIRDEKKTIILPFCGFGICYEHVVHLNISFDCPVCQDHVIDKNECFNMRINVEKIDLIKLERSEEIHNNPELFIEKIYMELIKQVDFKREKLKSEFNSKLNEYYQKLIDEINKHKKNLAEELTSEMEYFVGPTIESLESMRFVDGQDFSTFKLSNYFGCVNFKMSKNKDFILADLENLKTKRSITANYLSCKFVDQFETGEILVCTDYHIQIYDDEFKQKINEIKLFNLIKCAKIYNCNEIACGFNTGYVQLINKNTGQIVNKIEPPFMSYADINALEIWSDKVVTRTFNQIKVWDPKKYMWTIEINILGLLNNLLIIKPNRLLCYDKFTMVLFDLNTKMQIGKKNPTDLMAIDKINDEEFISVHDSGFYRIWCSSKFTCKIKFNTRLWSIRNVIALSNNKFLIYSENVGISIWHRNETVYSKRLKTKYKPKSITVLKSGNLILADHSSSIDLLSE